MAVTKKNLPPAREMPMDAAVEAAITPGNDPIYSDLDRRRSRARNMTDYQRRKLARDSQRIKFTVDIDPELKKRFDAVRQDADVPNNDLVNLLLYLGINGIEQGVIDLDEYKYNSNLPRYRHRLIWEKDEA